MSPAPTAPTRRALRATRLALLLAAVASAPTVAPSTAHANTNTASAPAEERPSPRRFPSVDLSPLTTEQQQRFMRIVDEELCPCEGSIQSLGECLEEARGTCGVARDVTTRIAHGLLRGESDATIRRAAATTAREANTRHTFALDGLPYKGAARPTVTMITFADFECPYCREFARITEELLRAYPNDLRVYFMHYPLSGHANAMDAALAVAAAQRQGKFWEMHDRVFAQQAALRQAMDAMPLFTRWASEIGLDIERFQRDIDDPALYERIQRERSAATNAGARGTPAVFLNGVRMLDIDSTANIRARINALIEEAKP